MILYFSKVRVHNFFCYADAELDLCNMGYSIVSGKNNMESDGAVSNGSGKSSIFNAVCYALTGETAQGLSNNIENIYTNPDDCWVEVEFKADNDDFIIRRSKTPRPDMRIYVNGEDRSGKGIRESQQLLRTYLPDLTSQLIGSIIILGQGLPYRFTYNTPSARKTLLESLTKSDYMVQTIRDKLDNRKEDLRQLLRSHEDRNVANNTQIKIYSERLVKLTDDLNEYNECSQDGDIEDRILDINEELDSYKKELKTLEKEKKSLEKELNSLVDKKSKYVSSYNSKLQVKLQDTENSLSAARSELVEGNSTERQLEKELHKIESITDICPTCGQKIPNVHKIDTADLKSKLESAKLFTGKLKETISNLESKKKKITFDYDEKFNSKVYEYDLNIHHLSEDILNKSQKISNIENLQRNDIEEKTKLETILGNYSKIVKEIEDINSLLEKFSSDKNEIELNIVDTVEHLNVVQGLITLAKREFRSALLVNVVAYMDKKAKEYAKDVFGVESLSIVVNDNYIDVMFNNKYYEALSGGEKQKVDIIIQLALRDLLSNQLNIHSNILVLDEGLDFLDTKGSEAVLNLIQNRLSDVESVFIISHHVEELNISYDTEIVVEKGSDGISNLFIH